MLRYLQIFIVLFSLNKTVAQCPTMQSIASTSLDCLTGKGIITVSVTTGTPPYTFTWSPSVSTTSIATNLNTGQYNITYMDANNCSFNAQVSINLSVLMDINFNQFGTQTVSCFGGSNGAISALVTGNAVNPPFTYTWSHNGSNNPMQTNLTAGIYTLTGQDAGGCTKTATFNLIQPAQIASIISNSLNCFNTPITANITSTGGIAPYTYTVDGVPVSGNSVPNLSGGSHTIITKDANNCIKTDIVNVPQPASPAFTFSLTPPSCPTSSNGALSVTVANMEPPFNYTWNPGIVNNQTITNIPKGIYTVTVKDGKNCFATQTVNLLPISNIQTTVITKPETCSAVDGAATVQVSGGSLPLTYSFNTQPLQGSNQITSLSTGMQTVVVFDALTCSLVTTFSVGNTSPVVLNIITKNDVKCFQQCDGSLIVSVANAVAPISYSLTGLPIFNTNTLTNICSGTYTVKAIDAIGCYATAAVSFSTPPSFTFTASGTTQLCIGKTAPLQSSVVGGSSPFTYSWMPGNLNTSSVSVSPSVTTIYSLNVFDAKGCTLNAATVTVSVLPPLTVTVTQENTGICPGTTAQITPSVSGGDGNYNYLWLPGNSTGPSIFISNLVNPTYTFVVNDACGSPAATQIINLQIFPVTTVSLSADTLFGCAPLCVKFSNTTPKSSNPVWNFGDKPFEQIGSNPSYCYFTSGKFNVKLAVTDSNGCRVSKTINNLIDVFPRPYPSFITKPSILTDDLGEAELINTTTNANSFKWYVNDVDYGNSQNIKLEFSDTVCFVIRIIASNTNGCIDSTAKKICVKPGFTFYMPGTFTPNNDGLNDILIPSGNSWLSENYTFRIFDRWGQLIFQTHDIAEGWDGKIRGTKVTDEVFFYIISVKDFYNEEHIFKGHVNILR